MKIKMQTFEPDGEHCRDCISRKDTIEWLKKVTVTDGITFETGFKQILHDIEQMPSVEPDRRRGHITYKHRHHHNVKHYTGEDLNGEVHTISVIEDYEVDEPYCSECGKRIDDIQCSFCAKCGADMRERKDCSTCKYQDREPRECPSDRDYKCWVKMEGKE